MADEDAELVALIDNEHDEGSRGALLARLATVIEQGMGGRHGHGSLTHPPGPTTLTKRLEANNADNASTAPSRPIMRARRAGSLSREAGRANEAGCRGIEVVGDLVERSTCATKQ